MELTRSLYLDLMKKCLTNWIYGDKEIKIIKGKYFPKRELIGLLNRAGYQLTKAAPMDPDSRLNGLDWPYSAHTMVGMKRLDNIQQCIENVLSNNIPGDIIECGVWRGGASIFMRAVLKAYDIKDRIVYVADSFQGCPIPNTEKYPQDKDLNLCDYEALAVSLEKVKSNFNVYGLLDEQVRFLDGWFKDTLPHAHMQRLSVMRLDGDLYESTMDALNNLYPKLSTGGYVIVDDYYPIPACKEAVADYRSKHGITDMIADVDQTSVYWQRSK
jgi:hypothetical protein